MKKITLITLFSLFAFTLGFSQKVKQKTVFGKQVTNVSPEGIIRCATDEHEELLLQQDPKRMTREQFNSFIAPYVEQYLNTTPNASESGGIIYIPVVVHVIHNGDAIGTNENIADGQVESQITVMNQDFRRMVGTPGFNNSAIGADTQIQFVLAKVDPNGNPTNGINRVNLCRDNYNAGTAAQIQALVNSEVKPQTIWDPTQYMNMWSVNWTGSGLLGYAQFPSTGTANANTDGVVSGHTYFGSRTLFPSGVYADTTYDKGRTMTHEVGHYLGLYHTFQGGCAAPGDNISDTPPVATPNYGCPTGVDSCTGGGVDMIENYMDYTDDSCMNIFTLGQKAVITSVMNTMARRTTLKTSTKDLPIALFANDAEVIIENNCSSTTVATCANPNPAGTNKVISLYNRGTANLTSASLTYNINGGGNLTQNWTGNLAPNKFAYVTLLNTTANGVLNVSISSVNGGTDQRISNNSASKTFAGGSGTGLTNHNFTTYTFTLIGDRYGSEITWNLRNAAGTTLYSGGPYTDLSANGTQTLVNNQSWTLPANGCYTLTINDSYGDGLCCTYGSGSYSLRTNNGATVVATNTNFTGSSDVRSFTNNALSNDEFSTLNDIFVYPNPTKNLLNVSIPNGLELPKSFTINNYLGQTLVKRTISTSEDLTIDTSNFSNGVYLITLTNGSESKTLRFVKE